jgi:molybdenum-dependent DNA-binding transcriptional regulator ModE
MDRNAEVQRLAQADRHLSIAERAISHQIIEIERLREGGHPTALAEQLLETYRRTLKEMQKHRNEIIKTIEDIDAGLI